MTLLLLILSIAGSSIFLMSAAFTDQADNLLVSYAFLPAILAGSGALIASRRDVFAPLNLFFYLMLASAPLFAIYARFFANEERLALKLYGMDLLDLEKGVTLLAVGSLTIVAGYLVFSFLVPTTGATATGEAPAMYARNRLRWMALVFIPLALWSLSRFAGDIDLAGAIADGSISQKRVHEETAGVAPRGSALTHWRILATNVPQGLVFAWLALAWTGRVRLAMFDRGLILLLVVVASLLPFLSGSRAPIMETLLIILLLWHYLKQRIGVMRLAAVALGGLLALGLLGELRQVGGPERGEGIARLLSPIEDVFGAGYFADLPKNAIIVDRVPAEIDHLGGSSLLATFIAPIPRQLWPDKPIVRIGYFVGQEVIELNNQTGVPPGFIAELYLNFGYWGLPVPLLLLGAVLAFLYRPLRERSKVPTTVVFAVLGIEIVMRSLIPTDFTYTVFQIVLLMGPTALFLAIARLRRTDSRHVAALGPDMRELPLRA